MIVTFYLKKIGLLCIAEKSKITSNPSQPFPE